MATQIQIKRGSTTPAGLTVGESAMNTSTNQIYLGGTGGTVLVGGEVTGGVDMGAGSAVSANRIPTQSGVYNYVRNSTVTSFNGATGAVGGVTTSAANTFTALQSFSAGISAAGSTFSSTTNTLDVIASTEGAGLRIAKATTGANSRIGGIRLGRHGTTANNIYLEGSAGQFAVYNGVDNTANSLASFSGTIFNIGATTATQLTLNCPGTVQIGDSHGTVTLHNQKFTLDGSTRFFTFGDSNGTTAGFMGINRAYNGLCADYALEVNSPTGKGLQLIYNDHTGAASNWVNMDVSSGGNYTLRPSGGLATVTGTLNVSAGISAAGATFSGNIFAPNIVNSFNGITGAVQGVSAAVGSTYLTVSGSTGSVTFTNTGVQTFNGLTGAVTGVTVGGANTFTALNTFNAGISASTLTVSGGVTLAGTLQGTTAAFTGLLSASAGISASGTTAATFNGTVNCNSSTVYKPTLQYYNEPVSNPTITSNVLTVDLSAAQVFGVTLNAAINTFTISNTPATANRSIGFTLILTADGTARGITWGSPVKWSGGVTPTTTITNGKKDIFTFMTINGGTEWLGFIAGQNF